jgi:hypothetical protein
MPYRFPTLSTHSLKSECRHWDAPFARLARSRGCRNFLAFSYPMMKIRAAEALHTMESESSTQNAIMLNGITRTVTCTMAVE